MSSERQGLLKSFYMSDTDNTTTTSSTLQKRDLYLSQQYDKETKLSHMYHLCHPRTHLTLLGFILVTIVFVIFSIALICNWTHVQNTFIPYKYTSSSGIPQVATWFTPLCLCVFLLIHMWTVLGPVQSLCFLMVSVVGSFGMNELLQIRFHEIARVTSMTVVGDNLSHFGAGAAGAMRESHVSEASLNKGMFAVTQGLVLYLAHCMSDTIIYGRMSKHRMDESDGRRLMRPQLLFLPIFGGLIAFCIDEILFGPMMYNGGIVSFDFLNPKGSHASYFGMTLWYFVLASVLRVALLAVYLLAELVLDWCLVLVSQKLNEDPDQTRFGANLIYSFFRPAYSLYRINVEWIGTLVNIGRFLFVYVFLWTIWICLGVMFSTVVDPFILRVIGTIVFGGVGILSVAAVFRLGRGKDEEPFRIIN